MRPENRQYIIARLSEIKRLSSVLDEEDRSCRDRIENFKTEHLNRTAGKRDALKKAQKQLESHLKRQKLDIFPGKTDRVVVDGGVIIRQIGLAVRKAKHVTVAFLRGKGLSDGIRIEEHVNWQSIETWADDRLAMIGTERSEKETFAYELTED